MRYTQLTDENVKQMLATIGVASIDELFRTIPASHRLKRDLELPGAMGEPRLQAHLTELAAKNKGCDQLVCFMGGGAYDHFIPTVVDAMTSQGSFVTAYTPYQAEASQGSLQAFYEFQTMVCQLTGMDVSNASLYELGSAAAEAALMAHSASGRREVIMSTTVHAHVRRVVATYCCRDVPGIYREVGPAAGTVRTDLQALKQTIGPETAGVLVQSPNFFGQIEQLDKIAELCKAAGAALIVATDPISCGMLKRPGDLGADIVVAEGQPLGIPLQMGGPWCGMMAVKEPYMRRLPGRIVGRTVDKNGRPAYCLTLQTREQHIRREKATSNICTNQGLMALRAAVYMAAMGRSGIAKVARMCFDKAHYAAREIAKVPSYSLPFAGPFFKEFVVKSAKPVDKVLAACRAEGILGGVALKDFYPEMADLMLVAVTEKRTREEIDNFVRVLKNVK
ncbi:MAG TPA: aminomethyl-transferring glycine dehydrogenase subunit GcvPA [Phycisphaerae bacterium]|nr:aminomethyl-transferring glycine dehydrogenase subunit GcvPA [Phycisphaerae bacterium]